MAADGANEIGGRRSGGGGSLSRGRTALFAVATATALLLGANAAVEWAEQRGLLESRRPDDYVQFLDEPLFSREGDSWVTTRYAEQFLVPSRVRVHKGERLRVFVLGESFAMGTPYSVQSHGEERPGGIASWLRLDLEARLGPDRFEVVNVAAGAQTSHRVRRIAEEILQFDPDLLVVATCNNEGPPRPGYVREQLHKLGGYRLLVGLVAPPVEASARPRFTPQILDPEDVRSEFTANVRAIVDAAALRGVPVALATLPLNLRYDGEGAPLPEEDRAGAHHEEPCVAEGRARIRAGDVEQGLALLAACEDIPDAARWSGIGLAALGRVEEAREALELSVELLPLNRCRPSLNDATRRIAAESPGVFLVDFERAAARLSPQGLPGESLFVDYCHLNWRGYSAMADALVAALEARGLIPPRPGPIVDRGVQAAAWGLEPLPALGGEQ